MISRDTYVQMDAVQMAKLVRSGELSAEEIEQTARHQMATLNPHLHFLAHDFEGRSLPSSPSGAFAGVPILLKDELELTGTPMTMGSRLLADYRCTHTHPFVERLLQSGFRILGRSSMAEIGLLPITEPLTQPPVRNPWNRDYSPGGSSGGAAVAVASGVIPLAHAADGGGSIRIPASNCGLVGLKPSRGRTPSEPRDPLFGIVGQLCVSRTVRDTATFLDVMSKNCSRQYWVPEPERAYRKTAEEDPKPLRIALTTHGVYGERLHPEVDAALRRAAHDLEGLGHHVEEVPAPFETSEWVLALGVLWSAAAGVVLRLVARALEQRNPKGLTRALVSRRLTLLRLLNIPDHKGPRAHRFTRWMMLRDEGFSPSELWLAHITFEELGQKLTHWLNHDYDLWMTPSLMRPPYRIGELNMDQIMPSSFKFWHTPHRSPYLKSGFGTSDQDEIVSKTLLSYIGFNPTANATGLPSISLPMGFSSEGLPLGMQFLGPFGAEDRLLALAGQWERAHPWPKLPSAFAEVTG